MMSSLTMSDVKDIDTMLMNSDSKRNSDSSMITPPADAIQLSDLTIYEGRQLTLVYADHQPDEESLG